MAQAMTTSSPPKGGHRRKRGDTIRASDFVRPQVEISASEISLVVENDLNEEQTKPGSSHGTRRARSGTITLASVRGNAAPRGASPGIVERIIQRPKPESTKNRRRGDGIPQFKRTIHDKPLTPQGSDDSDDELLLTGRVCKMLGPANKSAL